MKVVADDGVGLEVVERVREGPTLLLVHGFGGAKEDFADHFDRLGETHRVVAFDHRGHAESDKPDDESAYTLDRMAADVVAVADALAVRRFRLLGVSMGGMVAQRVVLANPDRVEALVLMDTCAGPLPGIDPDAVGLAATVARTHGMEELKRRIDERGDPLATPAHRRLLRERPGYEEFGRRKFFAQSPAMYAAVVGELARLPDLLPRLVAVTCPTLVMAGEQDEMFLAAARGLAASIPGAELTLIPDAGHSPQFENPEAWFASLTGFLGRLEALGR